MASTMCGRLHLATGRVSSRMRRCVVVTPQRACSTELAVNSYDDTEVEYPPVKPKYPPGSWGDMDRSVCWQWHDKKEEFLKLPTIAERLGHIKTTEYSKNHGTKLWFYKALDTKPDLLEFQQNSTKTSLIEGLPNIYENVEVKDQIIENLKSLVLETLLIHKDQMSYLIREKGKRQPQPSHKRALIKSLLNTLITALGVENEHLFTGRLSERVLVEAHWDRYGVERWKPVLHKEYEMQTGMEYPMKFVKFGERFFQLNSKFQGSGQASLHLRTELPLPEFVSHTDALCTSSDYPTTVYWPGVLGQQFDWSHLKTSPGYNIGDQNQFGFLSVLNSERTSLFECEKKFGANHAALARRGLGMNHGFLWTVAQAYYQGFNSFIDVTYPFTTQSIITDGQKMSFFAYQLNTLHLWKNDEANPLRNLCWYTKEENLYDVIENGEVKGFNDNVFKTLLKFLTIKTVDRGYELKATLPSDSPDLEKKVSWIPHKKEEEVVIEEIVYDKSR